MVTLLLMAKAAQRRIAKLLRVNRKTVDRKVLFLGLQGLSSQQHWVQRVYGKNKAHLIQFDDMETFEHTKMKPVAISLMVEEGTRKIIDFEVSQIAAKGRLAKLSVEKYGQREDKRVEGWKRLMKRAKEYIDQDSLFRSDQQPSYPKVLREFFPDSYHQRFKGRRGCVVGQGELKEGGFDPLFSLNHTCAMIRDGLGCLVRRTWCTSKNLEMLKMRLAIYVDFHNRVLTPPT